MATLEGSRKKELISGNWAVEFFSGLLNSLTSVIYAVSLASLIFSGSLNQFFPVGVIFALISSIIISLFVGRFSIIPQTISFTNSKPAVYLSITMAAIAYQVAQLDPTMSPFSTVFVAIGLFTALTGIAFYLFGEFHIGRLIQFIPSTVVGGFIAGSGLLLILGSIKINIPDYEMTVEFWLNRVWTLQNLILWLPSIVYGSIIYFFFTTFSKIKPFSIPLFLILGIAAFYFVLHLTGYSIDDALHLGLLPPQSDLLTGLGILAQEFSFGDIYWTIIISRLPDLIPLITGCTLAIFFITSTLELELDKSDDVDEELKVTGIGNAICGLVGGIVGFSSLNATRLNLLLGTKSRLPSFIIAVVSLAIILFAGQVISFIPKPIIGSLLVFTGINFVVEWLVQKRKQLSWLEYTLMLWIMISLAFWSLQGSIVLGIFSTCLIFVYEYSQTNVVKFELNGSVHSSGIQRSLEEMKAVKQYGEQLYILRLQGFIFLGTAKKIVNTVYERCEDKIQEPLKRIILDFKFVTGIDFSALIAFVKLKSFTKKNGIFLIYSGLDQKFLDRLEHANCLPDSKEDGEVIDNVDHSIERWEDVVIDKKFGQSPREVSVQNIFKEYFGEDDLSKLSSFLEEKKYEKGDYIFYKGDPSDGLYLIHIGGVEVLIDVPGLPELVPLSQLNPGTIFGEMGIYLDSPRTATVRASEPSSLYFLSKKVLKNVEKEQPYMASLFHRAIVRILADRLDITNEENRMLRGR